MWYWLTDQELICDWRAVSFDAKYHEVASPLAMKDNHDRRELGISGLGAAVFLSFPWELPAIRKRSSQTSGAAGGADWQRASTPSTVRQPYHQGTLRGVRRSSRRRMAGVPAGHNSPTARSAARMKARTSRRELHRGGVFTSPWTTYDAIDFRPSLQTDDQGTRAPRVQYGPSHAHPWQSCEPLPPGSTKNR